MAKIMVRWDDLTPDQKKRWAEAQARKIEKYAVEQRLKRDRKLEEESNPKNRDKKPVLYVHEGADRDIIVIGAKSQFLEDLKDMARRRAEEPFLRNPERYKRPHPMDTLRTVLDMKKREAKGLKVFGPEGPDKEESDG